MRIKIFILVFIVIVRLIKCLSLFIIHSSVLQQSIQLPILHEDNIFTKLNENILGIFFHPLAVRTSDCLTFKLFLNARKSDVGNLLVKISAY